jgi:REP element-mobilizing transposase RayT
MDEDESLSHPKWECKYHVVFIPKCRRKTLYGQLRQYLGEVFRKWAEQKESRIEEGHLLPDHVHMMISIPPKYAVAQVIGFIKGKSAIHPVRLLRDATAFQQASEIRKYVEAIRSAQMRDESFFPEEVEQWSTWALAQADRIDPAIDGAFLKSMEDEAETKK